MTQHDKTLHYTRPSYLGLPLPLLLLLHECTSHRIVLHITAGRSADRILFFYISISNFCSDTFFFFNDHIKSNRVESSCTLVWYQPLGWRYGWGAADNRAVDSYM